MKEINKFDKWIGILSISVLSIVAIVFVAIISNTHLAKGTYGIEYHCYCSSYEEEDCKWASSKPTNSWVEITDNTSVCGPKPGSCGPGKWAPYPGATCIECSAGHYCPAADDDEHECGVGTYQDNSGQSTCKSCGEHTTSEIGSVNVNACHCTSGYYQTSGGNGQIICTECPAGSYCPGGGSGKINCDPDYYSEAGASTCIHCPDNKTTNGKSGSKFADCVEPGVLVPADGCYPCGSDGSILYLRENSNFPTSCSDTKAPGYIMDPDNAGYCKKVQCDGNAIGYSDASFDYLTRKKGQGTFGTFVYQCGADGNWSVMGFSSVARCIDDARDNNYCSEDEEPICSSHGSDVKYYNWDGCEPKSSASSGSSSKVSSGSSSKASSKSSSKASSGSSSKASSSSGGGGGGTTPTPSGITPTPSSSSSKTSSGSSTAGACYLVSHKYVWSTNKPTGGTLVESITKKNSCSGCEVGYSLNDDGKCVKPGSSSEEPINPQTGTTAVIFAWIIGLFAIGYSFWYFKRSSTN